MRMDSLIKITFATAIVVCMNVSLNAQDSQVNRVAKNPNSKRVDPASPSPAKHALDPCILLAKRGLNQINKNIADYTGTLVRRERVNGTLGQAEYINFKMRNPRIVDGKEVPFSIYMRFKKPTSVEGREAIWVKGQNDDKIVAHEAGLLNFTVRLDPNGLLAMRGNKYPMYDAGLLNLVNKLIEKAEHDKKYQECEVKFFKNAKINGRVCTLMQVTHPVQRDHFEFHIARIYIDNQLQLPIRYASWSWPTEEGGKPVLEEEYTYINLKVNVGLTDNDFSEKNKEYDYK